MTMGIGKIGEGIQSAWESLEGVAKGAAEGAGEAASQVSKAAKKAPEAAGGILDSIEKSLGPEKKDYAGVKRPVFFDAMMKNETCGVHFEFDMNDVKGGGGKIALWVRHAMLTHVRENGIEDTFLSSLASTTRDGVEAVWKDVLCGVGVPVKDQPEMISKLADETSWVALTLVKDKVRTGVLEAIDAAHDKAKALQADGAAAGKIVGSLLSMKDDATRLAALAAAGIGGKDAGGIVELLAQKGKGALKEVSAKLGETLPEVIGKLEDLRDKVFSMPLGKFHALLDFEPQLDKVMGSVGAAKNPDGLLATLVDGAKGKAFHWRMAEEFGKFAVLVAATGALSAGIAPAAGVELSLAGKTAFHAAEALVHAAELSIIEVPAALDDHADEKMLETLGLE
jgi:hypothetical protein